MCLFGRTLVTVTFVQEKHDEQKHENGGDVERGKKRLGTSLLESGFDTDLARNVDDGRGWSSGEIHLLPKKDVFYTGKERAEENPKSFRRTSTCGGRSKNALNRRTFFDRRDVQSSRQTP